MFCYYNIKLRLRDKEVEKTKVAKVNLLDLLVIDIESRKDNDDQVYQWLKPIHVDDNQRNLDT